MSNKNISEVIVPEILKKDGVVNFNLNNANKEIVALSNVIGSYPTDSSWAHTLVNSDSNSATLICQMAGEGNRRHFHPDWNEWWFIVEGAWDWEIEGDVKRVSSGDIVFIEKGRKHKITAVGDGRNIRLAVSRYDVAHVYD